MLVAVHEELTDRRTPGVVRYRVMSTPEWLEVRTVQETETTVFPVTLHRGERERFCWPIKLTGRGFQGGSPSCAPDTRRSRCRNAVHQRFFFAAGGAKATAASVVSSRKVKVSCK